MSVKIRVVVPVYNEEKMLPHFLSHYETFADSIVVWDNGSDDRTREIAKAHPLVELKEFKSEGYDEEAVLGVLHETKEASRKLFDWLIFPDCDEFVRARTAGAEREVIEGLRAKIVAPEGYCLVGMPHDAPIDLSKPLLPQRRWGWKSLPYSKPVVHRADSTGRFAPGKHWMQGVPFGRTDELLLIHLEMIDFELWVYRKNRRPLSEKNIKNGWCTLRFCRTREEHQARWASSQAFARDLSEVIA